VTLRPRTGAKRTVLGTVRQLPSYLRLLGGLMFDGRVSLVDRLMVVGAFAYIVSPLDFIPDVIPFLGQVDDVFLQRRHAILSFTAHQHLTPPGPSESARQRAVVQWRRPTWRGAPQQPSARRPRAHLR
jgi:uncharacterized membrane protein YkvA (DUF1232 family)